MVVFSSIKEALVSNRMSTNRFEVPGEWTRMIGPVNFDRSGKQYCEMQLLF